MPLLLEKEDLIYNPSHKSNSRVYGTNSAAKVQTYIKGIFILLMAIASLFAITNFDTSTNTNTNINFNTNTNINIQLTEPSLAQQNDLKRLGLTPKKSIKLTTPEKGEQIIHGRFLHITDIHPDPYFKIGSSFDEACHGSTGDAQKYGNAISGCDSSMIAMNDTIKWIAENLKDKIDFIVWTGDNIRHDNDRNFPRTEQNIFEMNELVSNLMYETFKKKDTPELEVDLIPSLGNNDVFPHNLFSVGPTLQTRELFQIWQKFIPQAQMHVFNRGAYFFKEVIPGKLAILSINTLYWYQLNPLVDNCDGKKEPGYKLFEWLGYVLKEMRARKMKVWLTGHVPPNEKNYDLTCLRKYVVWTHEFRDVIIGGLYGHMNLDHIIPLDSVAAYKSIKEDQKKKKKKNQEGKNKSKSTGLLSYFQSEDADEYDEYKDTAPLGKTPLFKALDSKFDDGFFRVQGGVPANKVAYMETLRESLYAEVKGKRKSGNYGERYSIAHVASSIVPTFNPGLRVWEYNITELANELKTVKFEPWDKFFYEIETLIEKQSLYDSEDESKEDKFSLFMSAEKKRDKTFPLPMPKTAKLGPAYIPQTFTPERYVNYYADLEAINKGDKPFGFEIEYMTDDADYQLPVLTVDSWLKLARDLGKPIKTKREELDNNSNSNSNDDDDDEKEEENGKGLQEENEGQVAAKGGKGKKGGKGRKLDKLEALWKVYLKDAFVSSDYEHKGLG